MVRSTELLDASDEMLSEIDRGAVFHPSVNLKLYEAGELPTRLIESASGCHIIDSNGRRILDGFGGLYCVNAGYGRAEIIEAIAEQARKLAYFHIYAGYTNEAAISVANKVLRLAPEGMSKVFFGLSGSDANETQVKIVWYYNNVLGRERKKKIISRHRSYHGSGVMSGSLTGVPVFHAGFDLPLSPVLHTTAPHYYWNAPQGMTEEEFSAQCATDLEKMILDEGPDTVAAFIAEPAMGSGGIVPPPAGYWAAIQPILRKYDVLLIADEVVCGFGRLGEEFGCYRYDIQPDLITTAKGLTSAYAPLSACIVSDKVWQVLKLGSDRFGAFAHGYTYSGHPIGLAAAIANLELLEREKLTEGARSNGAYLQQKLGDALGDHPLVAEVRGEGLLAAVELVADKQNKVRFEPSLAVGARLSSRCYELGLVARAMPGGDILGFAPPLCIERTEIDFLVETTKRAVDDLAASI